MAQQPVTAASTTINSVSTGSRTYNATGAGGSGWASNNYAYRFGTASGSTANKVFLNNFVAGGTTYAFEYGYPINVVLRRVNNTVVSGQRDLLYSQGNLNTATTPNQINVNAPYVASMATVFIGNDDLRSGTDNLFGNTGDGSGNNNNIERLDVLINATGGYQIGNPSLEGFAVFERGAAASHDPFVVAVITAVDAVGNPSAYTAVKRMAATNYNTAANPLADANYFVLRRDNGTGDLQASTQVNTQGIGGIFFRFADFGIAAGTKIYGYSLAGGDFPTGAAGSAMVNVTNATNFPLNTNSGAEGGLDFSAITGVFRTFNNDLDPIPNNLDQDDDNDGIPDIVEYAHLNIANLDAFGDGDGDGILNYVDQTPGAATVAPAFIDINDDGVNDVYDADLDGRVNQIDLDSDNDGIPDLVEAGGVDTNGDGLVDVAIDSDNDGLYNQYDAQSGGIAITNTFNLDTDGDGVKNFIDLDSDNDGIPDVAEAGGVDQDGDGRIDNYNDSDSDGFDDTVDSDVGNDGTAENAASVLLKTNADANNDGRPDSYPYGVHNTDGRALPNPYDLDSDNDGISDIIEVGGTDTNNDGKVDNFVDADKDGLTDDRDTDVGNDGIAENIAKAWLPTGPDINNDGHADSYPKANADGGGRPNPYDLDSDGDGIPDLIEAGGIDSNGDGRIDNIADADNNGWQNAYDPTQGGINIRTLDANGATAGGGVFDFDGDGIPNYLDLDSDNDGIPDIIEAGGTDANNDGRADATADADDDGFLDNYDPINNGTNAAIAGATPLITTATIGINNLPTAYSAGDNFDGDILPNHLDLDTDGDGIIDNREAGLNNYDTNSSGTIGAGDTGFTDTNSDGWADAIDNLAGISLPNTDVRGGANYLDIDADDDGILDNVEGQSTTGFIAPVSGDTDGDGISNAYDTNSAFGGPGIVPVNTDGTDVADYLDLDSDNDGFGDRLEGWDTDGNRNINGTEKAYVGNTDSDGDGLLDEYDTATGYTPVNGIAPASYPNIVVPSTPERDWREAVNTDGDPLPDGTDTDDDNDGIPDLMESGGIDPLGDADNDGIPNYTDRLPGGSLPTFVDANNDGISDVFDFDRDGIINSLDLDSDNDGIPDIIEAGGVDADFNGRVDGVFADTDGDGLANAYDPNNGGTALGTANADGDTQPNFLDLDSDNDGIPDLIEQGGVDANGDGRIDGATDANKNGWTDAYDPTVAGGINLRTLDVNGATAGGLVFDFDGDGIANYLDIDSDNDGIFDIIEQGGTDSNNDGKVDATTDVDKDGFVDTYDPVNNTNGAALGTGLITSSTPDATIKLPTVYSTGDNFDGKGLINMLDLDSDDDGILDSVEGRLDTDGDGKANYLDIDSDNDGIIDNIEAQTTGGYLAPSGTDTDGDGVDNAFDGNSVFGASGITPVNTDGADGADYLDLDSDNDGYSDRLEGWDTNGNKVIDGTEKAYVGTTDTDGDGLLNEYDNAAGFNPTNGTTPVSYPNMDKPATAERDWREVADNDGDGIPDTTDIDDDNDGITDVVEGGSIDTDGDGIINAFDLDSDNDGIPDVVEAGGLDADNDGKIDNATDANGDGLRDSAGATGLAAADFDGDGLPNFRDLDSDGDGILDTRESGLGFDLNNNGVLNDDGGYVDANKDGWSDAVKALATLNLTNTDGNGKANYLDIDSDDDGITDNVEGQSTAAYLAPLGTDADKDGIDSRYDNNNAAFGGGANNGITPNNHDLTDEPDYLDSDSDNDGDPDRIEGNDLNKNARADDLSGINTTLDTDGDGLLDFFDNAVGPNVTIAGFGNGTGGLSTAQRTLTSFTERDWRNSAFSLSAQALPVRFVSVRAAQRSNGTLVEWQVAEEQNVLHYEVERSFNGSRFEKIGTVAYQQVGTTENSYSFVDASPAQQARYYRIRQVDIDGKAMYSTTVMVRANNAVAPAALQVYPNPVTPASVIVVEARQAQKVQLMVVDGKGQVVARQTVQVQKGSNVLPANLVQPFAKGMYVLLAEVDGQKQQVKLIK
ncbi:T9SS type A sorting domain-containing protein [Pseudocnuella soli]|uniref:T9SS type A sorting domain-containing protein n=1 Tax=Pseudocnuella soli TaxID=2502779 RepID=UPI0014043D4B|nr:T9SS type A sorting domain-containing protein [Pseudocnuella soli]